MSTDIIYVKGIFLKILIDILLITEKEREKDTLTNLKIFP